MDRVLEPESLEGSPRPPRPHACGPHSAPLQALFPHPSKGLILAIEHGRSRSRHEAPGKQASEPWETLLHTLGMATVIRTTGAGEVGALGTAGGNVHNAATEENRLLVPKP